jgi:lipoyl synthase
MFFHKITMAYLSPEGIWKIPTEELHKLLNSERLIPKPKKIRFYAPSFTYYKTGDFCSSTRHFPAVSITGSVCSLDCKHCGGKVLETMHAAKTPKRLFELCKKLKQDGALGVLISGGCMPNGSVPLEEFIPTLRTIKQEFDFEIMVHTGIINGPTALQLKEAGIETALIDIIGDNETIQDIYNLNLTTRDYEDSLRVLRDSGLDFVPHVIVGLHNGELKGEFNALKMIYRYDPAAIVIISFMPIRGTKMEQTRSPSPIDIARTAATARTMFPTTPIVLGCMRPKGKHRSEIDLLGLKAGFDGIAFPCQEAIRQAQDQEYDIFYSSSCCAEIYKDMSRGGTDFSSSSISN